MSSGIDFGVHCEICFGIDVHIDDLWVDGTGQRWSICRACYQQEHDEAVNRMRAAEVRLASIAAHRYYQTGQTQYDCICGEPCGTRERWNTHFIDTASEVLSTIPNKGANT